MSIIPFIRNDYWIFRVFEYPRIQKLVLTIILLITVCLVLGLDSLHNQLAAGALLINTCYLLVLIIPFTPLAPRQVMRVKTQDKERQIRMFIGNVYQHNKNAQAYLQCVLSTNADLILLVETDKWWADQVSELNKHYPYKLLIPQENTYGMLLYSKFQLLDGSVKYLVEDDIPSVHSGVKLPSGDVINFHGIHPTPPVPNENPRSTERDKEILLVGKTAKESDVPVIVAGDLNDVAWSYTTELFSKISGLLDPRKGRGFFNTFHAHYFFLRFPLDHIFCSNDFTLVDIKRLKNCGSDHFPMCVTLQYTPMAAKHQEEPTPDADDLETAQEKLNKTD